MNFNKHYELGENDHALLSPSQYHWVNYDLEKLTQKFLTAEAAKKGTRYHAYAKEAILLGIKQAKTSKTLNMFINDAIGYRMTPEQPLVYSEHCFGTADAIAFNKGLLRIHDLKTGVTKASMVQLEVYAAIFCLEYDINPLEIDIELRIYQHDDFLVHTPDSIPELMNIIIRADQHISSLM